MGTTLELAAGVALVAVAIPRRGEDFRPFLRGSLMPILYPSLCLVLISLGLVAITAS